MERRFNLIKSDFEKQEKRVLPRFPFCYLTFKPDNHFRTYEVKDISSNGMQLALKDCEDEFRNEQVLKGHIHWPGKSLDIQGVVKWHTPERVGIEFEKSEGVLEKIKEFLHPKEVVKRLKPLHQMNEGLEIPNRLKYWLQSDGPVELFVWQHSDGEIAKFQVLFFTTFLEWEDGQGIKTGKVISTRSVDSPLHPEDEWIFQLDPDSSCEKLLEARELIGYLTDDMLPTEVQTFLLRQLT